LEADSQYREDRVSLSPQDVVLYYTDGLTEAVNTRGERFDEGNLHRVFREACLTYDSAEGILNYIFEQVQTFRGSRGHPQDDMTLVVARVQSPG
jgi:sigma-B regulation protein RsbU (phosphoserine phosphatase)